LGRARASGIPDQGEWSAELVLHVVPTIGGGYVASVRPDALRFDEYLREQNA
jgi:hypothetical protein